MSVANVLRAAAPWRVRELTQLDADLGRRHALSTRVGVVGVAPGVGTSTVAGTMGALLAERRGDRVLAVNAAGPGGPGRSLLWHAGLEDAPASMHAPVPGERFEQVAAQLPQARSGAYGIDLGTDERTWWTVVAPRARFFDVVVCDWGARSLGTLGPVAASSSVVCVVAPQQVGALQLAVNLAGALDAAGVAPVVCVTDLEGRTPGGIAQICDTLPYPVARFSHERGRRRPGRAVTVSARLSAMRAAAAVLAVATTTQGAGQGPAGGTA